MDAEQFDGLVRRLGRRRMAAVLGGGIAAAAFGWLRPAPAAAIPYCGNCDGICENCFNSYDEVTGRFRNRGACAVCGHCAAGNCSDCTSEGECDPVEP